MLRYFGAFVLITCLITFTSFANEPNKPNLSSAKHLLFNDAKSVYESIDSLSEKNLSFDVFAKAYQGFINLKLHQTDFVQKDIITICDYSLSANTPRMWIIDLANNKLLIHTLVAHGEKSGEEYASRFSNRLNSHQTSLGFFLTGRTYFGDNGYSLKLHGQDMGFNHMAEERAIVLHGAPYVSKSFIQQNKRLGRSWGCPAVAKPLAEKIINIIKEGSVIYAHYPHQPFLKSSIWLKKVNPKYLEYRKDLLLGLV